jgi:rhodanese-related sulfurtransferase
MVILSIGVRPDTRLAKDAGLNLGDRGGIAVNDYMQTSDKDIYAVGDAVETLNPVLGKKVIAPLAWPANKQGRIVADNIAGGNKIKYKGTIATAIAKVFDLTVGVTGATEKQLTSEKIPYLVTIVHPFSHAGYYPDALQMSIKLIFSPKGGTVLGAQAVGCDGVDKRIDVIAAAIWNNNTVYDLTEFEHAYAPPYSSAKDPVNMAAFTAENILNDKVKVITWDRIDSLNPSETVFLDVRTPEEINFGKIKDAMTIPVDELRSRFKELPKRKKIVVYCRVGLRGYIASRILAQSGFTEVYNLAGGYLTYSAAGAAMRSLRDC